MFKMMCPIPCQVIPKTTMLCISYSVLVHAPIIHILTKLLSYVKTVLSLTAQSAKLKLLVLVATAPMDGTLPPSSVNHVSALQWPVMIVIVNFTALLVLITPMPYIIVNVLYVHN